MGSLSHIGILPIVVLCIIVSQVNSYSKYGRGCGDIGCLPNEECVIERDSCGFGQRDGKECGSYPTCTKKSNSASRTPGASLNPAPDNTRMSQSSNPSSANSNSYNQNPTPINPHYVFGAPQNQPPIYPGVPIFPHYQPTSPPPFQQFPQASNPNYPPYPGQMAPRIPSNPYNPPYVFGHQPTYYNPQATTRAPSLLHQFLYNKQDRTHKNSSGRIHFTGHHHFIMIASLISLLLTFNCRALS